MLLLVGISENNVATPFTNLCLPISTLPCPSSCLSAHLDTKYVSIVLKLSDRFTTDPSTSTK